ncbi:MAG: sodium-dependent bicarbonate transport family permease [Bacillota bacterium]|nr:sodium-dependent bicarbonate transport family permease [Bacillota bacterium]
MENILELALKNLSSPVVLFFALGLAITLVKAKVEFPVAISDFLSIYLLVAIGFKGGVAIAQAGINSMLVTVVGAIFLGLIIPIYSFYILWRIGKMKSDDAAAIAGHYGSVSVVTFMAATAFLSNIKIGYEGFLNGLPALMEIPAIIVALILAALAKGNIKENKATQELALLESSKKVIMSKSVILLIGAMGVGYLTGPEGAVSVEFFYKDIFMGMLSLFMLEMGMLAALRLGDLKKAGIFIVLFSIFIPLINGFLGVVTGSLIGLSLGGITLLGVLAASSSYIVAPAAMRVSLPKASPALYLGTSLGITLPFNLIIGIPIYYYLAQYIIKFN